MTRVSKERRSAETLRKLKRNHEGQLFTKNTIRGYASEAISKVTPGSASVRRTIKLLEDTGAIKPIPGYDDKYELGNIRPIDLVNADDLTQLKTTNDSLTFDDVEAIEILRKQLLNDMKSATAKIKVTRDRDALEVASKIIKHLFKN